MGGYELLAQPVGTTAGTVAAGNDPRLYNPDLPTDRGYVAWTAPPTTNMNGAPLGAESGAGILNLARIRRVPAASISAITVWVGTAGSGLSNCGAALYTSAGVKLGQTGDVSAQLGSIGPQDLTLTGGPLSTTAGDLYVGLWFNGTGPSLIYACGYHGDLTNVGLSAPVAAVSGTGITTTAPTNLGAKTAAAIYWWVALKGSPS